MKEYLAETWQKDLSPEAFETMRFLGNFGPLVDSLADKRQVKGYMVGDDGGSWKVYLSSRELREMASHFIEVADWLDERARIRS